ncbi:hypothetical protein DERF_009535 [Dermatophagoides farinae]|uniref:Uncharacterized protein n=1 Tax=Dermatophagoides farinae TaxID=6954 RepID=A0A922HVA3_DERFA|nr:hypothetical protein DERF_009535 [Dermatophagoides farinae]
MLVIAITFNATNSFNVNPNDLNANRTAHNSDTKPPASISNCAQDIIVPDDVAFNLDRLPAKFVIHCRISISNDSMHVVLLFMAENAHVDRTKILCDFEQPPPPPPPPPPP